MKMIVYTKTNCVWGIELLKFLQKNNIDFEERNMTENKKFKIECIKKTGQYKCPTVDLNGYYFPDTDSIAMQNYLESIGLI